MRKKKTLAERYWEKVAVAGPDKCWMWTASANKKGYGLIWDGTLTPSGRNRMVTATRLGYRLRVDEIPEGLHVLHTCDTPGCHNDAHWFLGTNKENVADKWAKGRGVVPHLWGERHGATKLTDAAVLEICTRYNNGGVTQKALALEFGVSQPQIHNIVHGRRRHLTSSSSSSSA